MNLSSIYLSNPFRKTFPVIGIFFLLLSCSQEAETNDPVDPWTGMDTTKAIIGTDALKKHKDLDLIPYSDHGKWGFADNKMNVIVPPRYDEVRKFKEEVAVVVLDSMYGLIDKEGNEIVTPMYRDISDCACGVIDIRTPAGYLLVRLDGKRVINQAREGHFRTICSENMIPFSLDNQFGFIGTDGKTRVPFEYSNIYNFSGGVAPVEKGGKWGVIDKNGKPKSDFRMNGIFPFNRGRAVAMIVGEDGMPKWGVIDENGKEIIPFRFGYISGTFAGDYIACADHDPGMMEILGKKGQENTWFIFDRKGNPTGSSEYSLWDDFSEGMIATEVNGKFGFSDHKGRIVIKPEYDWACGFAQGLAWVKKGELYGFIDHSGKEVIPIQYASTADYVFMEDDGAMVMDPETEEVFYIDREGKEYREK